MYEYITQRNVRQLRAAIPILIVVSSIEFVTIWGDFTWRLYFLDQCSLGNILEKIG